MECSVIETDLTKMCQHIKRRIQMKPSTKREGCNCLVKLTSNFVEFVCNVTRLTYIIFGETTQESTCIQKILGAGWKCHN